MFDKVRLCVSKILECCSNLVFISYFQNTTNHSGTAVMNRFPKTPQLNWNKSFTLHRGRNSLACLGKIFAMFCAKCPSLPVPRLSSVRSGHLGGRFWTGRAINSLLVIVSSFTRRASIACREYAPELCLELFTAIKTNVRNQVSLSCHERIVSNNVTWHLVKLEVSPLST